MSLRKYHLSEDKYLKDLIEFWSIAIEIFDLEEEGNKFTEILSTNNIEIYKNCIARIVAFNGSDIIPEEIKDILKFQQTILTQRICSFSTRNHEF